MERVVERGLQAVAAWLTADAAGCRVVASCANLLWRGSLLAAARPGPSGGARLVGALRAFPRLAPRLQQVHLREAARAAAGLHTTVLPLLQEALAALARAAAEAWALALPSASASSAAGEDAAALLAQLRQALAARTCARVRAAARLAALGDGSGGGGGGSSSSSSSAAAAAEALALEAQAWEALAREWEEGALQHAHEFAELEAGVWRATAGGASLRELCSGDAS